MTEFILKLARESGLLLKSLRTKQLSVDFKTTAIDLVTDADRKSEEFIREEIAKQFPSDFILGEEGSLDCELIPKGRVWIVDPLDGTVNYAHHLPLYSVSIALVEDYKLKFGAVFIPEIDELYWAERGEGAYLNGEKISVSSRDKLSQSLLATGFPYDKHFSKRDNLENFGAFIKRARGVRRMGVASIDLCFVAAGRLDGFWEEKLKPGEVAAGTLIVREAGGIVSDFYGNPFDLEQDHITASNGKLHPQILEVLSPYAEKFQLSPSLREY